MLTIVTCTNCHKSGTFDVEMKFRPKQKYCKSCGHDEATYWHFHFCTIACLLVWMGENNINGDGFPCQDCIDYATGKPSGFMGGFKQNGKCYSCNGTKASQGRRFDVKA
jgi:hypothetical protein